MVALMKTVCEDIFENRLTVKERDEFMIEKFTNTFYNPYTDVKANLIAEALEEYKNSDEF